MIPNTMQTLLKSLILEGELVSTTSSNFYWNTFSKCGAVYL